MNKTGAIFRLALLSLSLLFAISSCGTMSIGHEYDPKFNFSTLKTYSWIQNPNQAPEEELILKRIRPFIDKELEKNGFQKSEQPDFKVAAHIWSKNKIDLIDWGYGYGWRGAYSYGFEISQYEEGALLVDIVDAETNELVWQGLARAELNIRTPN